MTRTSSKRQPANGHQESPQEATSPLARCRPRGDLVVVQLDRVKKQHGSIILPESYDPGKQQLGTVVSVGPGNYGPDGNRIAIDLKAGDRVVVTGYAGLSINDPATAMAMAGKDDDYIILKEEDVLAVL